MMPRVLVLPLEGTLLYSSGRYRTAASGATTRVLRQQETANSLFSNWRDKTGFP